MRTALLCLLAAGTAGAASYEVRAGDTAWSLARRHGLSVQQLLDLNHLPTSDLRVGQRLIVPDPPQESGPEAGEPAAPQSGFAVYYWGKADPETRFTAAHLTLPFGTWVKVTHRRTGRSITVKINDRGPFGRPERIIDVSETAATELGILREGVAPVTLHVVARP